MSLPETRHIINAERLRLMKPTAWLVNTARGSLIDEQALEEALESGQLAGAGLDVREDEPPRDARFNRFENVVLTTHVAGVTVESLDEVGSYAFRIGFSDGHAIGLYTFARLLELGVPRSALGDRGAPRSPFEV